MAANIIQFGQNAHESLRSGINELADIVKTTLGPRGKNVIIDRPDASPIITQNGREIAEMLELTDLFMNLGVKVLRDIAIQTGDVTGKGTSTAIVLAQAMIESGFNSIESGTSSTDLRDGFHEVLKVVVSELKSQSNTINSREEIRQIVELAVNGDSEVADLIVSAFEKVGKDGHILFENNDRRESELNVVGGLSFQKGILNETPESEILEDPLILLTNEKLVDSSQLSPILNSIRNYDRNLIIFSVETSDNVLSWIERFNSRNAIKVYIIEAPGYGNEQLAILYDIAIFTGGNVIATETGLRLENISISYLGRTRKVFLSDSSTDIVDGAGSQEQVIARIHQIRRQIEEEESEEERQAFQERLQNLSGGAALISIGGGNKESVNQRRVMAQHALIAVKAAFSEGVVPGGGVAYIRAQQALNQLRSRRPELATAIDIINRALEIPLRAIAANADEDPDVVVKKVQSGTGGFGFNAQTRTYEDLVASGIIDPLKVVRTSLEHAVQLSGVVVTSDTCIVNEFE